jgi:hypothetical protein
MMPHPHVPNTVGGTENLSIAAASYLRTGTGSSAALAIASFTALIVLY